MPKKQIHIWVETDTLGRLKSGSVSAGKSLSDFADTTLRRGLDPEGPARIALSEGAAPGPALSGFDPEPVRKAVEAAIQASDLGTLKAEIRALERTLFEGQGKEPVSDRPSGFSWTKDQAAFLIYTIACINRFFEEYNAAWNTNDQQKVMTRTRLANDSGTRAVRKYFSEGEENRKEQREKQEDGEKR